jgi:hypothetical protein
MRLLIHVESRLPGPMLGFIEHISTVERDVVGKNVEEYDLVVIDDRTALQGPGRDLVERAIEADRAVLLLNGTDEHKDVLGQVIGFSSPGPSLAYVVRPVRDHAGRQHFQILEQLPPSPLPRVVFQEAQGEGDGITELGDSTELDLGPGPSQVPLDELARFAKKVKALVTEPPRLTAAGGPVPPDLKWKSWVYSQCQCFTASGSRSNLGTPANQYISCQTTYEFDGYLNNWPETGAFQYLFLRQSGIFETNGMAHDDAHTKGWYLTQLAPSFRAPSQLVYYQSSPPNVIGKTSATTSSGFTVNFDTGGAGASYEFSSSETWEIADWEIVQLTGNSWRYSQARPYPGTTTSFPDSMVESNDKGELKGLPAISKYSLQFDVQLVWKTNELVRSTVQIDATNYLRTDYIITHHESGTKWTGYWWYYPSVWQPSFTINLGLLT